MNTETKTCCVTGHRDIPVEKQGFVEDALRREVAAAIEDGYTRFISGFAAGVDLMFATVIAEAKKKNNGLFLEAAIPYAGRLKTKDKEFQNVRNHFVVAHRSRSAAGCAIQHAASILRPVGTDTVDLQRKAIVQAAANGPATDCNPHQLFTVSHTDRKFVTNRGFMVAVVSLDKGVCLTQCNWYQFQQIASSPSQKGHRQRV